MGHVESCKNILLAEDELLVRNLASALLRGAGYNVIPACDANDALQLARTHAEIHALITDVQMGDGMNGIELAKRLLQEKPGIAVLIMSGTPGTEMLATEQGFPFLPKPFTSDGFIQGVRELLARFPVQSEIGNSRLTGMTG